jgi:hypothetical protein
MTSTHDRIQALTEFGFTDRQARFLVLVMRHAGVCVPRQYARFAGVAYGAKCNAFFDKLVRRGFAHTIDCIHNRARLYHVHSKALYHVIGDAGSRYRRPVSPRLATERLMLLDAVLTTPALEWFTTAAEKAAYLARLTAADGARTEQTTSSEPAAAPPAVLPGTFPIGMEPDGRTVLLYLATEAWADGFRAFLEGMPRCSDSRRRGRYESRFRARSMSSTTRISESSRRSWNRRCTQRRSVSLRGTSSTAARPTWASRYIR